MMIAVALAAMAIAAVIEKREIHMASPHFSRTLRDGTEAKNVRITLLVPEFPRDNPYR
jgi:hypothetical protein